MPRIRRAFWLPAPFVLVLACAEEDSATSAFSGGGPGLTSAGATASAGSTGTSSDTTGESDVGTSSESAGDSEGTSGSTGTTTGSTGPGTTGNPDGLPNGAECSSPAQCMSGNCYTIPLPIDDLPAGICGVCDADQDCVDAGLGIACSVDVSGVTSKCTDGSLGSFCETQAACKGGLWCEELLDGVNGLLPMSCSTCRDDADCDGGARCTPEIDVVAFTGHKRCALPGSVENDGMCPVVDGAAICKSGHCGVVTVLTIDAGVCGECSSDADCGGGTCTPGKWADGFVGSVCG